MSPDLHYCGARCRERAKIGAENDADGMIKEAEHPEHTAIVLLLAHNALFPGA